MTQSDEQLCEVYRRRLANVRRLRRDPHLTFIYALKCATHYHYHKMVQQMTHEDRMLVNAF